MKHIEQIQPEVAAGELSGLLLADATATAALTALLHNVTGCDIPQTDTTPSSEVDELVPLAVSILRRHWQTPLPCLGSHPNGSSASVADRDHHISVTSSSPPSPLSGVPDSCSSSSSSTHASFAPLIAEVILSLAR